MDIREDPQWWHQFRESCFGGEKRGIEEAILLSALTNTGDPNNNMLPLVMALAMGGGGKDKLAMVALFTTLVQQQNAAASGTTTTVQPINNMMLPLLLLLCSRDRYNYPPGHWGPGEQAEKDEEKSK
jgi:hypothetical protein